MDKISIRYPWGDSMEKGVSDESVEDPSRTLVNYDDPNDFGSAESQFRKRYERDNCCDFFPEYHALVRKYGRGKKNLTTRSSDLIVIK